MAALNRRVVAVGPGQVEIQEDDLAPLGPQDVRIQTQCSLISPGTELAHLNGPSWQLPDGRNLPQYPCALGYCNAGKVVEVGDAVASLRVGDRVASSAAHASCPAVRAEHVWPVPEGVDLESAAFCTLACTVLNGVRLGRPQLGDAAVVVGLGLLGQMACQFLRLFGARPVIGVDLDDFRLGLAADPGAASHVLNPDQSDTVAAVQGLTECRGADVVYEVTGLTRVFDVAFDLARLRGTVVSLGSPRWAEPVHMMQLHMKALNVVGAIVTSHPEEGNAENRWTRRANAHLALQLLAEGALSFRRLITHRLPASGAASAYAMLAERTEDCLGVALDWTTGTTWET